MARHTIGHRRGSVKGAPPSVYVPFGKFSESDDAWKATTNIYSSWIIAIIIWVIFSFAVAIGIGIGWIPEDFAE